jgi:hypothetical protein
VPRRARHLRQIPFCKNSAAGAMGYRRFVSGMWPLLVRNASLSKQKSPLFLYMNTKSVEFLHTLSEINL